MSIPKLGQSGGLSLYPALNIISIHRHKHTQHTCIMVVHPVSSEEGKTNDHTRTDSQRVCLACSWTSMRRTNFEETVICTFCSFPPLALACMGEAGEGRGDGTGGAGVQMKTLTSVKRHALTDTRTSHSSISTTSATKPPKALDSYSNSTQLYQQFEGSDLRGSNFRGSVVRLTSWTMVLTASSVEPVPCVLVTEVLPRYCGEREREREGGGEGEREEEGRERGRQG